MKIFIFNDGCQLKEKQGLIENCIRIVVRLNGNAI
jgi:hypothetical protein